MEEELLQIAKQRNYTIVNLISLEPKSTFILNIQCNNCGKIKKPTIIDFRRKNNNCRCNMSRDITPVHTIINKCEGIYSKKFEIDKIDDCYQIDPQGTVTNINTRRALKVYTDDEESKYVNLKLEGTTKTKNFPLYVLYACCVLIQPTIEDCEIVIENETVSWKEPIVPEEPELDLSEYYSDGVFSMNNQKFVYYKKNFSKEVFANAILDVLKNFKEPIMPKYTERIIKNDFQSIINDKSELRYNEIKGVPTSIITANTKGIKLMNHFTDPVIIYTHKNNRPSYYEAWNNPDLRKVLVNRMIDKDVRINNRSLFGCFGCQYGRLYNFPVNIAKFMYNTYGKGGSVLDFCAGFAGRLLGFWASDCKEYIGIDPNKNVPYPKIIEFLKQFEDKKAKVYYDCAEDMDYSNLGKFDLIFTSPPYFKTEIYSEDPSQSCHRYGEVKMWLEKFLYTTLQKCSEVLKMDGTFAINIKNSGRIDLVNPMIKYMEKLGFHETDRIMMSHAKRHNNNKTYEYIYIFNK
jgi:tRNA1(Val) A37 N6-methylase TrmN6